MPRQRSPQALLGGLRVAVALLVTLAPVTARGARETMLLAVVNGEKLEETASGKLRSIDCVPAAALADHDCSGAAPCWALVKAATPMPALVGGATLSSCSSMALLRTYSFNSGTTNRGMKSTATVLSHRLLTALHAIDPMSYLFAYRSEASNKVYPPSSPSPSPVELGCVTLPPSARRRLRYPQRVPPPPPPTSTTPFSPPASASTFAFSLYLHPLHLRLHLHLHLHLHLQLVVLPTPLDAAGIINGDNEPRVPRSQLDPIWRQTGTSVPESESGPQEAQARLAACACTPPPPSPHPSPHPSPPTPQLFRMIHVHGHGHVHVHVVWCLSQKKLAPAGSWILDLLYTVANAEDGGGGPEKKSYIYFLIDIYDNWGSRATRLDLIFFFFRCQSFI